MSNYTAEAKQSEQYWTNHNITLHKEFGTPEESLDYFHWRNAQYIDYIKLLPVSGHDGKIIVDYGCGPGNDLVGFLAFSKPQKVYGIDISETSLAEAKSRLSVHGYEAELIKLAGDDKVIPLDEHSVGYVHCSGVLMIISDPVFALAEFHRILKPGGYARLMVYNYHSIWVHLYVAYVLKTTDERYRELSLEEAFRRSTDGFDCPISRNWTVPHMLEMAEKTGFQARHLGNSVSLFEMSLLPQRFTPMMDPDFYTESREFLSRIVFDNRGIPYVDGMAAGVDACFELRKE